MMEETQLTEWSTCNTLQTAEYASWISYSVSTNAHRPSAGTVWYSKELDIESPCSHIPSALGLGSTSEGNPVNDYLGNRYLKKKRTSIV